KLDTKTGYVFKRNPDFYQKDANGVQLPYLDGITFPLMTDETARLTAFRTRQIDLVAASSQLQAEPVIKQTPEVRKIVSRTWSATNDAMNNTNPALKDRRVRLAFSKAINRKEIIETAWLGDGWTNQAIPLPGLDWMIPQEEFEKAYQQDIPGAKKLLAEAGFGDGFSCPIKVAQGFGEFYVKQAEMIQSYLKQVNVTAPLVMLADQAQWIDGILGRGEFECMAVGPQPGQNEADLYLSTNLHSKGSRNISKVNDPKLDQLIEMQSHEISVDRRKATLLDIQRMILENMYVMTIRGGTTTQLLWPYVNNYSTGADRAGRFYRSMWLDQDSASFKQRPQ
ncbi:MAG: ABC transporter substrate-binding protein, partial [Chloroflexi bacterium]|nr:ABC transporter substrate-binding protein [Chloroflexota bacterium]